MSKTQKKVIKRIEQIDSISLGLSQFTRDKVEECLHIANNVEDYVPRFEEEIGKPKDGISLMIDKATGFSEHQNKTLFIVRLQDTPQTFKSK